MYKVQWVDTEGLCFFPELPEPLPANHPLLVRAPRIPPPKSQYRFFVIYMYITNIATYCHFYKRYSDSVPFERENKYLVNLVSLYLGFIVLMLNVDSEKT